MDGIENGLEVVSSQLRLGSRDVGNVRGNMRSTGMGMGTGGASGTSRKKAKTEAEKQYFRLVALKNNRPTTSTRTDTSLPATVFDDRITH